MRTRCLLLPLLLAAAAAAQTLPRDVATASGWSNSTPGPIVDFYGAAFFAAQTPHGNELWRSDGSVLGTFLLKDIEPGQQSSYPNYLTVAGSHLFFTAHVTGLGYELWRTDGSPAGTILLRDHAPGSNSGAPTEMIGHGRHVYYAANEPATGMEVWRSDGTSGGTTLWLDLEPGPTSAWPSHFAKIGNAIPGGHLFFVITSGGVKRLVRSEGTSMTTHVYGPTFVSVTKVVGTPAGAFLLANAGQGQGTELYFTDGTFAGTRLLRDMSPGPGSGLYYHLRAFGNGLLFAGDDNTGSGQEPWFSDGTAAGTVRLADIWPGATGSSPENFCAMSPTRAVFTASSPTTGTELYVTDGTPAGTALLDLWPGSGGSSPSSIVAAFGGAVFAARTPTSGTEPWFTDGTAGGTWMIGDLAPGTAGSNPADFAAVGNRVFFGASTPQSGTGLFVCTSPSTAAFVTRLTQTTADSNPAFFRRAGSGTAFRANDGTGEQLWHSDGTSANPVPVMPGTNTITDMCSMNDTVFMAGTTSAHGAELIRWVGAGPPSVLDLVPGPAGSNPRSLAAVNGRIWFGSEAGGQGTEPCVLNTALQGAIVLGDFAPGSASSYPDQFTACGPNRTVFSLYEPTSGREVWVSDATPAGTRRLLDINPGNGSSDPGDFLAAGNLTWFAAYQPATGRELWVTDGTTAGTRLVADLEAGGASSNPQQLVRLQNGTILFVATDTPSGAELRRTDGTAAGTALVGEVVAGSASGQIRDLVAVGPRAFFTADDGVRGRELWATDGLQLWLVRDVYAGPADGVRVGTLRPVGTGEVLFAGADGNHGLQLWRSDGTAAGTRQVGKIGRWAGSGAVEISDITEVPTNPLFPNTWFVCDDGFSGKEPWRIWLNQPTPEIGLLGPGCPGTGGRTPALATQGTPQLSTQTFAFHLLGAPPSAFAMFYFSIRDTDLPIIQTCRLYLEQPMWSTNLWATSPSGTLVQPFGFSAWTPTWLGLAFYSQALVLDPNGSLYGIGTLSNGVSIRVGW